LGGRKDIQQLSDRLSLELGHRVTIAEFVTEAVRTYLARYRE